MEMRRRAPTVVVTLVAIAAGVGGGAYLWKESLATNADEARRDGGVGEASTDARAGRGKTKSAKRGGRGKPRAARGQGGTKPNHGGGSAGAGVPDDSAGDESSDDEGDDYRPPPFRGRGPAGPTYEAAIAANKQEITIGGRTEPDLTDGQISGPMRDGVFVSECGAPDSMKVTVKVAIKMGHAAGVSVSTSPPDPDIAGCIDRYVRTFSWPSSTKTDSFTTTY